MFRLQQAPWDHWLLVRRKLSKPDEMAYYVVFGPAATSLEALARIAGRRWPVEECFETAKQEVGLDGYEVRSWHGWYRHITLSMLALAFLAAMRVELASQKGAEDPAHSLPSACPRSVASSPASRSASASTSFSHGRSGVGSIRPSPKPATGNDRPPNS